MSEPPFRLRWCRTWDDEPKELEDYAAWDGDILVGRFYRIPSGPEKGRWFWTVTCFRGAPTADTGPHNGRLDGTARDAARMVEAVYDRWVAAGMTLSSTAKRPPRSEPRRA